MRCVPGRLIGAGAPLNHRAFTSAGPEPGHLAGVGQALNLLDILAAQGMAGQHDLQAVIFRGIVAAGQHNAAARAQMMGGEVQQRGRHEANIDHIPATGAKALDQDLDQPRAGLASVPPHHETLLADRPGAGADRPGEGLHGLPGEGLAHDATYVIGPKNHRVDLRAGLFLSGDLDQHDALGVVQIRGHFFPGLGRRDQGLAQGIGGGGFCIRHFPCPCLGPGLFTLQRQKTKGAQQDQQRRQIRQPAVTAFHNGEDSAWPPVSDLKTSPRHISLSRVSLSGRGLADHGEQDIAARHGLNQFSIALIRPDIAQQVI